MFQATRALLRGPPLTGVPLHWQKGGTALFKRSRGISVTTVPLRYNSNDSKPPSSQTISSEHQRQVNQKKLESHPEAVSSTSTLRTVLESPTGSRPEAQGIQSGLKHDIGVVKDTFRLDTVPRESHILGLSGTLPYLATSLSTVFLAWDLTKELPTGNVLFDAVFINHETARYLLDVIEPVQLGYGAVIISFLGAIHWGLEYAEKQPLYERTRFRYGMGLGASIIAWPTLFMPIEYALTTQFMAFVALYYADSRATTRGWAPHWYAKYRFLLTAMVGLAIFISLIGRAKIAQQGALSSHGLEAKLSDPGIADKSTNWAKLEAEEKKRIKEEKEAAEKEAKKAEREHKRRTRGKGKPETEVDEEDKKKDEGNEKQKDSEGEMAGSSQSKENKAAKSSGSKEKLDDQGNKPEPKDKEKDKAQKSSNEDSNGETKDDKKD